MAKQKFIADFCAQMQSLGYVEGEVNAFVRDIVQDKDLSKLNDSDWEDIADQLNSYLSFARRCKKVAAN